MFKMRSPVNPNHQLQIAVSWRLITLTIVSFLLFPIPSSALECPSNSELIPGKSGHVLVVLLHAFKQDPSSLCDLANSVDETEEFTGADFLIPEMQLGLFSMSTTAKETIPVLLAIDDAWNRRVASNTPYDKIILIGHSIGGLFARKLYVLAAGETDDAPFEPALRQALEDEARRTGRRDVVPLTQQRPWAKSVERIVLMAAINNGWSISHHMSISRAISMYLGTLASALLDKVVGREPIVMEIKRGSPYITQLRLQWIAMEQRSETDEQAAGRVLTVQLLGTIDDLVSPNDSIDLISGRDFVYLEVPESGHRNVIETKDPIRGRKRAEIVRRALSPRVRDFNESGLVKSIKSLQDKDSVTDVVFIIHGIRDEGYWTQKIAHRIKRYARELGEPRVFTSETASYGYFPMASFLNPGARFDKVQWLMERYSEARANYSNADFHYIGHSNGTYLLAKALEKYPAIKFDQVVFAGSVVKTDFDWTRYLSEGRIKNVKNFVATADWVVAFFPKALQSLNLQDVGSAGHDGFTGVDGINKASEVKTFVIGGHGAAIKEPMWNTISRYIVTGNYEEPPAELLSNEQNFLVKLFGYAPVVFFLVIALLGLFLYALLKMNTKEWKKTLAVITYLYFVWTVLTRV